MTVTPTRATGVRNIVVARQPIVDRSGDIYAYELLFRSDNPADYDLDGEQKTVRVVSGTIAAGIDRMADKARLFCNAERGALTGSTPLVLPPRSTTVEVLETVDIDEDVIAGCRELVGQGFQIALDDFVWRSRADELLALASVVKIDLLALSATEVVDLIEQCRPYGVSLLAEKVETSEQLAWATAIGFDLFQGYAIERPQEVRAEEVAPSTLTLVQLAAHLAGANLSFAELENVLRPDPGLSLQVLQLASIGASNGMRRTVRSVREALVLMGTARVARWASLAILNSTPTSTPDGYVQSLTRARACELLARQQPGVDASFAFTAGMISGLEVLLGVPSADLAELLEIDQTLKAAAFAHQGPVGDLVAQVLAHEDATRAGTAPSTATLLDVVVSEAFGWALEHTHTLVSTAA